MITVIRIIFGIVTFFLSTFFVTLISTWFCKYDEKRSNERIRSLSFVIAAIMFAVTFTLLMVEKGVI